MSSSRQLHLNVNLLHSGTYASAWRLPESDPRACFDISHYVRVAQIAERGKLDAIFLADTPAITDRIEYRSSCRWSRRSCWRWSQPPQNASD
jgi:alkanesulfonate monooxygenase SsuD/methylene tetrahydromethanopterin reductase-like flavin-dependent oxidoreductase (luciferase family)